MFGTLTVFEKCWRLKSSFKMFGKLHVKSVVAVYIIKKDMNIESTSITVCVCVLLCNQLTVKLLSYIVGR